MIGVNPDLTSHYCDRYDREYEEFSGGMSDFSVFEHQSSRTESIS